MQSTIADFEQGLISCIDVNGTCITKGFYLMDFVRLT